MDALTSRMTLATASLLALLAAGLLPRGIEAARLNAVADDPVKLSDLRLDAALDAGIVAREITAALAADDAELAQSFLDLADERGLALAPSLRARVAEANGAAASAARSAGRFVDGFVVGRPDDAASLAGTVAGDLLVYGDLRDVVRETSQLMRGEAADELILGLACVGLAVTAGTYASFGAGAPARVGLSVIKAAGRTGRMTARMTAAVIHPLRAAVDTTALARALGPAALLQPAAAVRGVRSAVKIEKADGLVRVLGDIGRVNAKAGTRAALDGLKLADGPKDVAKLAKLADAKGGKTRAVLKLLGRGAIALGVGLFELTSWMFWALLNLFALVAALKRLTERAALRYFAWRRRARARRLAAAAAAA